MIEFEALEGSSHRHLTPCGTGEVVWREWGSGPVVVLLHGGFGSWLHWIRNIDALAARHRVLAVDLPGLGDSELPNGPVTPASIAAPLATGLETLLAPDETCHLVGFSFGGLIAGQVASMLPERVRSLTLVGASGLGLPRQRTELIRRTPDMSPEALREAQRHNVQALMLFDPKRVDEMAMAVQAHNDARARIRSRRMSLGEPLREVLPALCCELNGIWGEHDVTGTPGMRQHRELLQSLHPGVDFRVIPRAGHWVQYESSEVFNEMLLEMLSS